MGTPRCWRCYQCGMFDKPRKAKKQVEIVQEVTKVGLPKATEWYHVSWHRHGSKEFKVCLYGFLTHFGLLDSCYSHVTPTWNGNVYLVSLSPFYFYLFYSTRFTAKSLPWISEETLDLDTTSCVKQSEQLRAGESRSLGLNTWRLYLLPGLILSLLPGCHDGIYFCSATYSLSWWTTTK